MSRNDGENVSPVVDEDNFVTFFQVVLFQQFHHHGWI
jgi:hypothetical protein